MSAVVWLGGALAAVSAETILNVILLATGPAFILIAVFASKRLKASGPIRLAVKDLFSVETSLVGLVALIGVVFVGAALFVQLTDYRGKLAAAAEEQKSLSGKLEAQEALLSRYERASFVFKLDFAKEPRPQDLDKLKVKVVVKSQTNPQKPRVEEPRLDPEARIGGIMVNMDDLRPGDEVMFIAEDDQSRWISEPAFAVPSVTLTMQHEGKGGVR
jgi:hypothetical protein